MEKLDLTKKFRSYYSAKPQPEVLDLDEVSYISITGKGDPSSKLFLEHVQALYTVAYGVKFQCKAMDKDFAVPKLEGLWWFEMEHYGNVPLSEAPQRIPRSEWHYQLLIRIPEFVTNTLVEETAAKTAEKKNRPLAKDVTYFSFAEGKVVQMLHVGPFATEPETLQLMEKFILANKFRKNGLHHEIYLSDFTKTAPDKLKTILREPVI